MKQLVRAFVVVLVLTGAVASTQTSSASTKNKVTVAKVSMLPIPTCPRTIRMPAECPKVAKTLLAKQFVACFRNKCCVRAGNKLAYACS